MISFRGRQTTLCDGISRREWMRLGGLGAFGLGLPDLMKAR